jgi:serine/threonine-protein kinase ATR
MHLSSSASGEFCLQSIRSSIRELRVATGYIPGAVYMEMI